MNAPIAASLAGFLATAPMSVVMLALHKLLPGESNEPLPPRQITDRVVDATGADEVIDEEHERTGATVAAHFGYGAAAGAGYAALAGQSGMHPAAEGALYGLSIWGGSYLGLMPATGLYKSATEDATSRNVLMIAAHLVWGAALGLTFARLTRRPVS